MKCKGLLALSLLVASCTTGAVNTPEQAKAIALSSVCAQRQVNLAPHETMPTSWVAERKGDRWYVSLPFGPGAQYSGIDKYGHMGAWIDAKDGKILSCESGASRPLGQVIAARSFHAAF
jgi:hypothetical protein